MQAMRRCAAAWLAAASLLLVWGFLTAAAYAAGTAAPGAETAADATPAKIQALYDLLADPQVRGWIEQHAGGAKTKPAGPADTGSTASPKPSSSGEPQDSSMMGSMSERLGSIRQHLLELGSAVAGIPDEFAIARERFQAEVDQFGVLQMLLLGGGFIGLGFVIQRIYRRMVRPVHRWLVRGVALNSVGERIRVATVRFSLGVGLILSYAIGSVGAFLVFAWPILIKEVVLGILVASLLSQLARALCLFLLSPPAKSRPSAESYRIVPLTNEAALFWNRRLIIAAIWLAYGSVAIQLLGTFGLSAQSRSVLFDVLDLVLLALGIEAVWRSPRALLDEDNPPFWRRLGHNAAAGLLTGYLAALWVLWAINFRGVFALALVVVGLPLLIGLGQRSVNHILRPPGAERDDPALQTVTAVVLERGVRAMLIVAAAVVLGRAWQVDMAGLSAQGTLISSLLRGLLSTIVIALVADLLWHVVRVLIDGKLLAAAPAEVPSPHETSHDARMRTLLPILRNALFVLIAVIAIMMALSSIGVQIAPLIASAGVVGVAVGFGSQTLVRDIISGVFYLLDDAFRVGEYIQSGSYKGVVESFSLRSVRLRHHRGPVYTVPFGSLGAVQNLSRDWTIEKMSVGVAYNTDLAKVKKLIKGVGKQLVADPELAPHIIETLKLQGIEKFGDYAIEMRMKMTTKPGEQFVVRRQAFALIKEAFDANGVEFAFPVVNVGAASSPAAAPAVAAAARQGIELVKASRVDPSAA
jgi:small-conductance mechanosensitive channel